MLAVLDPAKTKLKTLCAWRHGNSVNFGSALTSSCHSWRSCTTRRWVRVTWPTRHRVLGYSAAQRDGDHAGSLLCAWRARRGQKWLSGSRWHSCSLPTVGTFPCIQTCGKEAKKRTCAGCSRSLWTMKEARKKSDCGLCKRCRGLHSQHSTFLRLMVRIQWTV